MAIALGYSKFERSSMGDKMIGKKKLIKKIFFSFISLSILFFLVYLFSINQENIDEIIMNGTNYLSNITRSSIVLNNTVILDSGMYKDYRIIMPNEKRIIIRVDDAGAWHYNAVINRMTEDILKKNMSVVYAVIPENIEKDKNFLKFAESYRNNSNVEFAQHGYSHIKDEFKNLTFEEAYPLILAGKEAMIKYMGVVPVTFIPPYNVYNSATIDSINLLNFKVISSNEEEYFYSYRIFHASYNAKTFDYSKSVAIPVETTIRDCENSLAKNNLCVVMIHPQEFLEDEKGADGVRDLNEEKYQQRFVDLLDGLNKLDAKFTTFKQNLYY